MSCTWPAPRRYETCATAARPVQGIKQRHLPPFAKPVGLLGRLTVNVSVIYDAAESRTKMVPALRISVKGCSLLHHEPHEEVACAHPASFP
ncbi:uncharacterized protein UV8b_00391 [Ustilaginoidea virens]|uniref:Uncharacterized protein n=1 Tax=Ustilaginoidea virens TaxID=1159556 RepID=A0A8E5HIP0_USTVR|nr:uncharacterized protein UV8b_00391 [Ustilaginoidea virens]QUC16150.1 hypothetical protein UV8b_00391 [Ustilaginoidea virens]